MPTHQATLVHAERFRIAGRLAEAEEVYRHVLRESPQHADAWHGLGMVAHQAGKNEQALEYVRYAISQNDGNADYQNTLGVLLITARRLDEAEAAFREALRLRSDYANAHNGLGLTLATKGDQRGAELSYRQAIRCDPNCVDALYNFGNLLRGQRRLTEAATHFAAALKRRPDHVLAHNNLANTLRDQGQPTEAEAHYRAALQARPTFAEAHHNLAVLLNDQGNVTEAEKHFREALRLRPTYAGAHHNLGNLLRGQGRFDESLTHYREAIRLQPDFAEAYNDLGNAWRAQKNIDEAARCYQEAIRLRPTFAEPHSNVGTILRDQGRPDEATSHYREAVRLKPELAEGWSNLGSVLREQRQLTEAHECYREALRLKPEDGDTHWNRSLLWLLEGNFAQGWPEYEWRWKQTGWSPRPFLQQMWDGSSLVGRTILLHAEQGLGDSLQFIRYAPLVKARGGTVIVECPAALTRLFATCQGVDRVVTFGDALPAFDVHAPLMSLPAIFRTTLDNLPAQVPYLFPGARDVARWRDELRNNGTFQIGIVWRSNPAHKGDRSRSLPLEVFLPLAKQAGVRCYSLQKEGGREQLTDDRPITDLAGRLHDFHDTAAAIRNLDLVIACDTAVAHLAGALGIPVWVALPYVSDWRWLLERDDSPWYPSMRLFRQAQPGDWSDVFERISTALRERANR